MNRKYEKIKELQIKIRCLQSILNDLAEMGDLSQAPSAQIIHYKIEALEDDLCDIQNEQLRILKKREVTYAR